MAVTEYPFSPPAATPGEPAPEDRRPDLYLEDVDSLPLVANPAAHPEFVTSSDRVSEPRASSPISLTVDELSNYIAQDVLGAVYGVGRTPAEAMADFDSALDTEFAFLRSNRQQLSPKLLRRLARLERLFPDR